MIRGVGIIGLCIMKMQNEKRFEIAEKMNHAILKKGLKLVWFTYFEDTTCLPEAGISFGMLDKSFIDGLIVCSEESADNTFVENVIRQAKGCNTKVVSLGVQSEECVSVPLNDYDGCIEKIAEIISDMLPDIPRLDYDKLEPMDSDYVKEMTLEEVSSGEDRIYTCVNRMLDAREVKDLIPPLSEIIPKNAYFCFGSEFLRQYGEPDWDEEKYKVVPSSVSGFFGTLAVAKTKVLPEVERWMFSKDCFVLTPAISKDVICGYYAFRVYSMNFFKYRCRSIVRYVNIVLNVFVKYVQNRRIMKNMEEALFIDLNTGLPNVKGVSKWFKELTVKPENHEKRYSFTVYSLPKYTYIYENYGTDAIEDALRIVSARLQIVYGKESYIAKVQSDEFVVVTGFEKDTDALAYTKQKIKQFYEELEKYHRKNIMDYYIDVQSGYAIADPGWTGTLEAFVKFAANEMYLKSLNQGRGASEDKDGERDTYGVFDSLIKNNFLVYHLQPIISAKTGEIYAYEALMRSAGGINMSPLEILEVAKKYDRLDDVEHATLFNVMKLYADKNYEFRDRKLFINTIPGHFLKAEDSKKLMDKYGKYFKNFVYEVTEQNSISDEELTALKGMCTEGYTTQIAIDDYGIGHSNIVNLLRYSPQVIKIDRYLIEGIQNDTNKQMFVKSTIEFAALNGIKVLAEGVETFEEMQAVIEYGVDLIQGYYVARPSAEVIDNIPDRIKREVINENLRLSSYNRDKKVYNASNGETINLISLAMEQYTYVVLESGNYYVSGDKNSITDMHIKVRDDSVVDLTFIDINMRGSTETPLMIGKNSRVTLRLMGSNTLNKEGILVPEGSTLEVVGNGDLNINFSRNYGVGIGGGFKNAYGTIIVNLQGCIDMNCSGDRVVGIGGNKSDGCIRFIRGRVLVNGTGISILGIGSVEGDARIVVEKDAILEVKSNGNDAVGIGGMKGTVNIDVRGALDILADGERSVGIGSMFGENSIINMFAGKCASSIHCDSGSAIGTYNTPALLKFDGTDVEIYGEGSRVTGIGSVNGKCDIYADAGKINLRVLSGIPSMVGSRDDTKHITGAVITCSDNAEQ